jgi:hypothetical protein
METDIKASVAEMVDSKQIIYQILSQIQSPKTPDNIRKESEAQLRSLSQFLVQHAREIAEVASSPELSLKGNHFFLTMPDSVKKYAAIYFKGFI